MVKGGGSPPTSSAASSAGTPSLGMSLTQGAQLDLLKAQTRKTNAEAGITEEVGLQQAKADLDRTLANTGLTASQIQKVQSETTNNIATLENIKDENSKIRKATELLYQQASLAAQQQLSETQKYEMLKAQAAMYVSQAGLNNLDINAAKALDNLGRLSKELKPAADIIRSLIRK